MTKYDDDFEFNTKIKLIYFFPVVNKVDTVIRSNVTHNVLRYDSCV